MLDLLADGIIDKDEFRAKKESAKQRQHEITELIQAYNGADDAFFNTMEKLLKLATNAHNAFVGSKMEEKRELVNFVFSNLQLKGATLCYTLNFPFDRFENLAESEKWLPILYQMRKECHEEVLDLATHVQVIRRNFGLAA